MPADFDVIVGGGSISGLAFASEASRRGMRVLVAEEHDEVGEPEKCDGLVSLRGLVKYGYAPDGEVIQNQIHSAMIHSPGGKHFAVNATALDVVVLDRSAYDKQVAEAARSNGATIMTGKRVSSVVQDASGVTAKVGEETFRSSFYADCTGPASSPRSGILPAAKYEVEGDWIRPHTVEVFLDTAKYPGFFAWVIPFARHRAKVGAAGFGISPFRALDSFLSSRESTILRKVSAPIYVGGPVRSFVEGRRIRVGESAGQVKPTTAGGIMTSIAGAVSAAKWTKEAFSRGDPSVLARYQAEWDAGFLKEMRSMLRLRGVYEKLSNPDLEAMIMALATPRLVAKLSQSDFDFHATGLLSALGVSGIIKVARVVASAEVRALLVSN